MTNNKFLLNEHKVLFVEREFVPCGIINNERIIVSFSPKAIVELVVLRVSAIKFPYLP